MRAVLALAALTALAGCHSRAERAARVAAARDAAASGDLAYLPPLAPGAPARAATAERPRLRLLRGTVAVTMASGPRRIALDIADVTLGTAYRAAIVSPAGDAAPPADEGGIRLANAAGGIAALARDNPAALVMNGGFSASDASQPAGLLLVAGKVLSPFAFGHYGNDPAKPLQLGAVVCATRDGQIVLLRAADFEQGAAIADRCHSAFQATPFVAQDGQSRISSREPDLKTAAARTLLALDRNSAVHAVFFRNPVSLAVAAAVAIAPAGADDAAVHVTGSTARGIVADRGLGLADAVNLDGAEESTGAFRNRRIAGDLQRSLPSALVILPDADGTASAGAGR